MFELKLLSGEAIPRALEKAERYRLLHEPAQAASICYDILRIDPDNGHALVTLLLSLTDQFDLGSAEIVRRARDLVPRLARQYERAYYEGIICERQARALLRQPTPGAGRTARQWLLEAMHLYERAEAIRPAGNDDAILRWNACARLITSDRHLIPADEEPAVALLE
ncbi:MAG TPA: hypothetical protein VMG58_04765 [Candidatus Sulfotelmatobacter sp.]|nr:hypothetical protein [Candidatus Sulfotelmatobacter sp.]